MSVLVKQLAVGGFDANFSYLLYAQENGDACLIDPCGDVAIIREAVEGLNRLTRRYILLTHGHQDHTSGIAEVKGFFDAPIAAHPRCAVPHQINLEHRQLLPFGSIAIECLYTPGHTSDSITYHLSDDSAIFTGDTLFIDWCGYCEPSQMFKTMRTVLFPLADSNEAYPGHDYGAFPHAPLGREKRENPYLSTSDYQKFREELEKL